MKKNKRFSRIEMSRRAPGFAAHGRPVPVNIVQRHLADARNVLIGELDARNRLELEAGRYARRLGKLPTRSPAELRKLRQLASRMQTNFEAKAPTLPPRIVELPGVLTYSMQLAPTYAFGHVDGDLTGHGNSAFARRSTGEMELRFRNTKSDNIFYFAIVELGGFFFPTPDASRIAARVNPMTAFSWFMNSEGPRVFSSGALILKIVGFKGGKVRGESRSSIQLWRENRDEGTDGLSFDIRFATPMPMSASFKLNNSDFYLVTLRCFSTFATGGTNNLTSFTSGSISASLPSITLDVKLDPLVSQA